MADNITPLIDLEAFKKGGKMGMSFYILHGIFGEIQDCNGLGEYRLEPESGGTFIKVLGCKFLYRGDPAMDKVYRLEQAKSNLSTLPRNIVGASIFYSFSVILRVIFQRKKFIHDLHIFVEELMYKTLRHVAKPNIRVNAPQKEILRAMEVTLRKEFGFADDVVFPSFERPHDLLTPAALAYKPEEIAAVIIKFTLFVCSIMEWDCAYRFPLQDMFGELDKKNVEEDAVKEFLRIFAIATRRGVKLGDRFTFILKLLPWAFRMSPQASRIMKAFLTELDIEKVRLDDADYYFCLRRDTYNYKDLTLEQRMEELAVIDRRVGNQYVRFEYHYVDSNGNPTDAPQAQQT